MLRGGSWNNNQNNARCRIRNRNNPHNSNNNMGFRLVSHDFPLTGRQCHGSSENQDAGRGQKKDGVTCPWPAPDSRRRANIEEP